VDHRGHPHRAVSGGQRVPVPARRWTAQASEQFCKTLRDALRPPAAPELRLPVKAQTGDLIQRCTSDVVTIRGFLLLAAVEIFRAVAMVPIALVVLLTSTFA
jgi:ATP-binding cassette subfamily B protein